MRIGYLIAFLTGLSAARVASAQATWTVDTVHSRVEFSVGHLGVSTVEGRFTTFEGTVDADEGGRVQRVAAKVGVRSIQTGNENRDESLRSKEVFDASKHPLITMETQAVKWKDNRLSGTAKLTIKGISRSVRFDGVLTFNKVVQVNGKQVMRVGYNVTAKINRADFGVRFGGAAEAFGLVGETVDIKVGVEIMRIL